MQRPLFLSPRSFPWVSLHFYYLSSVSRVRVCSPECRRPAIPEISYSVAVFPAKQSTPLRSWQAPLPYLRNAFNQEGCELPTRIEEELRNISAMR